MNANVVIKISKCVLLLCMMAALFAFFYTDVPAVLKLPISLLGSQSPTDPAEQPTQPPTAPPQRAFVTAEQLNIRKTAGTSGQSVGTYSYGTEIFIYEKTDVNGVPWGRTDKGWVCLNYVHIGDEVPPTEPPAKPPAVSMSDENTSGKTMTKLSGTNIYVSADYAGKITLTINSERFPNVGKAVWTVGGQTAATGVRTLTVESLTNGTTIKLSVEGENFTYTVKTVAFSSVSGVRLSKTSATGQNPSLKMTYTEGSAWSLAPIYAYTNGFTSDDSPVSVTAPALTVTVPAEYQNIIEYTGGKIKVKSGVTKDQKVAFDVLSGDKTLRVTLNLVDDRLQPAFAIAYSANTKSRYGFTYTVGTNGGIKLSTLFRLLSGKTLDAKQNIVITIKSGNTVLSQKTFAANDSWASQKIAIPANVSSCDISLNYAAAKAVTLSVRVVQGAYNVEDAASWKAVPDGVSIAVLKGFSVPKTNLSAMNSGAGYYSKSIVGQAVYGNLVKISVPTFTVKAEANSFFLAVSGGTLQDVVIEGPSYGTKVSVLRSDGVALGTFVSGVETIGDTGVTIKNSYISGFRQPLRVNGGNVTIQNSTLVGGNVANIYVHASANFKLTNVKTIQFEKDGAIGMGIFLNNPATKNTFTVSNLTQYNYLTKAQVEAFVKRAIGNVGALVSIKDDDLDKIKSIKHGNAYHCGIILCGDAEQMSNITGGNIKSTYVRTDTITKGTWKLKSYIAFYGKATCSSCSHSAVKNYNADDFLDSK